MGSSEAIARCAGSGNGAVVSSREGGIFGCEECARFGGASAALDAAMAVADVGVGGLVGSEAAGRGWGGVRLGSSGHVVMMLLLLLVGEGISVGVSNGLSLLLVDLIVIIVVVLAIGRSVGSHRLRHGGR